MSAAAQEEDIPPPVPRLLEFSASAPIRLPQGYQVQLDVRLHNPAAQASIPAALQFRFLSETGVSLTCRNLSIASPWRMFYPDLIHVLSLPPESEQHLDGQVLVPATWYRGRGRLQLWLKPCQAEAQDQPYCDPEQEWLPLEPTVELTLY